MTTTKNRRKYNSLGKKRLVKIIPVGSKQILVYQYETGQAIGLCEIHCSLFDDVSRRIMSLEKAIERAYKLKEFYERQTTLMFEDYD